MSKIDIIRKLSSRKFWAALIGFITAILFAFNVAEVEIEKVVAIITAGATLIAYIFAEGFIDANREQEKAKKETESYILKQAEFEKVNFVNEIQRKTQAGD